MDRYALPRLINTIISKAQEKDVTILCRNREAVDGLFKQIMCSEFAEFLSGNYPRKEISLSGFDTKIILITQDGIRGRTFESVIIDELENVNDELLNTIKCHTQ